MGIMEHAEREALAGPSREVRQAVTKIENKVEGDTQVFYASFGGAVVLTDHEVYEVYTYDGGIIIQRRYFGADGWDEVKL